MTEKNNGQSDRLMLPASVRRRALVASTVMFVERLWPALWPAWGIAAVFISLSLFDVWSYVPGWVHFIGVGVFAAGFAISLYLETRNLAWPGFDEALRRIEIKSGLQHRPLGSLKDQLAGKPADQPADSETTGLWQTHKARLKEQIRNLRVGLPRSAMLQRDPYALRAVALLILVLSVALNRGDLGDRMKLAIQPDFADRAKSQLIVDAWIDPPVYTRRAPVFLTRQIEIPEQDQTYKVPEGSKLVVRFTGRSNPAKLNIWPSIYSDVPDGMEPLSPAFEEVAEATFEHTEDLLEDVIVEVRDGKNKLHAWRIQTITDQPPVVAFPYPEEIETTETNRLKIPYTVLDDYGVTRALAEIRLVESPGVADEFSDDQFDVTDDEENTVDTADEEDDSLSFDIVDRPPVQIELPVRGAADGRENGEVTEDLTSHPWAGLNVDIQLRAEDEKGQVGLSETVRYLLPERIFTDALAKAVIEQRKALALDPTSAPQVAAYMDAFTAVPERYFGDMTAYLLMRNAYYKLRHLSSQEELETLYQLLWDIALRLEEGDLARMAQNVSDLRRDLMEALANNRPQDEIDKLMEALRRAIGEYMAELARQGMQDMQRGQIPPMQPGQQGGGQSIEDMLQALEDRLRIGDMEGAMRILGDLMDQLENSRFSGFSNNGESFPIPGLEDLGDMIGRQRGLMDQTFRESQNGQQGRQPGQQPGQQPGRNQGRSQQGGDRFSDMPGQGDPSQGPQDMPGDPSANGQNGLSQQQGQLGQELDQLLDGLRGLGVDVPNALDRAQRAMEDAADRLARGDTEGALERQNEAVDQLRQGAQSMAQAALDELDRADQANRERNSDSRDPLGRPQAGNGPEYGNRVKVPDERALQRARDILEELRRRASELGRPTIELEYLERLLKRF